MKRSKRFGWCIHFKIVVGSVSLFAIIPSIYTKGFVGLTLVSSVCMCNLYVYDDSNYDTSFSLPNGTPQ